MATKGKGQLAKPAGKGGGQEWHTMCAAKGAAVLGRSHSMALHDRHGTPG